MVVNDFRDLKVWQKAVELFEDVVDDVEKFPKTEAARVISSQLIRSVSSISAILLKDMEDVRERNMSIISTLRGARRVRV